MTNGLIEDPQTPDTLQPIGSHDHDEFPRKQAEDEVAKRTRQLSVLYTISRAISQLVGLDQTLNNAMRVTLETLEVEIGAIFVLDSDGKTLKLSTHRGLSEEFAEAAQRVNLGEGMTGRAAAENRQIVLDQASYSPSWKFSALVMRDGFQTMISTPLCSSGDVVGVLNLATSHKRNFPSEELDLLITIGQILGNAVQNARLYEAAQQELAERKRAENEVRLLHEHLQLVISNAPVILYALDRNGIFTLSEGKGLETLGLKAGEVVGQSAFDLYQDVPEALTSLRLALAGEYVRTTIEGRGLAFDAWYSPLRRQGGEVVGIIGVATDITERKQAEKSLAEQSRLLGTFFRNTLTCIVLLDRDFNFVCVNEAYARACGRTVNDFSGRNHFEVYPSDAKTVFEDVVKTKKTYRTSARPFIFPDQPERGVTYWDWTLEPILDDHGEVEILVFTLHDVTERKRAEAVRSHYTIQLQGLADASWAMNSTLALNDLFEFVAKKACQIIGAHLSAISVATSDNLLPSIRYISASKKYQAQSGEKMSAEDFWAVVRNLPPHNRLVTSLVEHDGRSIGLIQLADKQDGWFTENDEAILEQLAQMASTAIANVQLFEQVNANRDRLESLSRRLVDVQEGERRHIARELHDEVGQTLTGLKLLLEIAKNSPTETVKDHLTHTLALVEQIAAQIHDLSLNLRPPMLDDLGLLPALLGLFDHYTAQTGVEVIPEHRGLKNQRFTTEIETAAYRIVQEALTNVARHAGVDRVVVRLWVIQNILGVQIEDRGVGFELESAFASRTSSGLSGMRERVTLLGGQFEVESKVGVGTTLTAQLPVS